MKRAFFTVMQFGMYLVAFAAGSFLPPFGLRQMLGETADGRREFIWDGVVLMAGLYLVVLGVEAARRRLRGSGPWTTLALGLAAAAGFAARFGFLTVPR